MNKKPAYRKTVMTFASIALSTVLLAPAAFANKWDGKYTASFNYKLHAYFGCSFPLPIRIGIQVSNGIATGSISNTGGKNTATDCKALNNGSISGSVNEDGKVQLRISQHSATNAQNSLHSISGRINGTLTAYDQRASKSFTLTKTSSNQQTTKPTAQQNSSAPSEYEIVRSEFNKLSSHDRRNVQRFLKTNGYYTGTIDGQYGRQSFSAISDYINRNGFQKLTISIAKNEIRGMISVRNDTVTASNDKPNMPVVVAEQPKSTRNDNINQNTETTATITGQINITTQNEAVLMLNELQSTIDMYTTILASLNDEAQATQKKVIADKITSLQSHSKSEQNRLSQQFSTPIRPQNANIGTTSFRASDTFPKVPYYIAGTDEIGEISVIPRVSDEGYLIYKFDFIDRKASYNQTRESIEISHNDVDTIINGLMKIEEWTKVSKENGIKRNIEKQVFCIPSGVCDEKRIGVSSTELLFVNYEDGSTSGKIQRNKGQFSVGFNFSVESSVLMSAYLGYMRDIGAKEFSLGVMSDDQVLDLFK